MRVPGALCADIKRAASREGFSTITMQLARNIFPERSVAREDRSSASSRKRRSRARSRRKYSEGQDPRALPQPDLPRQRRVRRRDGVAALLRQVGPRSEPRRGGDARRRCRKRPSATIRAAFPSARSSAATPSSSSCATKASSTTPTPASPRRIRCSSRRKTRSGRGRAVLRRVGSPAARRSSSAQQLYEQGLKVYTTLDVDLQSAAERALENQIARDRGGQVRRVQAHDVRALHRARPSERRRSAAPNSPYLQGAFIAMDPRTGAVRALVGGRDFDDSQVQSRDAGAAPAGLDVQADRLRRRHPERTPAVVHRRRLAADGAAGRAATWTPQNYDGKFEGPMPMRRGALPVAQHRRRSSSAWSSASRA